MTLSFAPVVMFREEAFAEMAVSDSAKLTGAAWAAFEKLIAPTMAATLAEVVILMGSDAPVGGFKR